MFPKGKEKDFCFLTEGVSCEASFSDMFALETKDKFRRSFWYSKTIGHALHISIGCIYLSSLF